MSGVVPPDPTDPRYSLANERTFLAYERTSVGLLVAAIGVMHFFEGGWIEHALGVVLLITAIATAIAGMLRYRQAERVIARGAPLPPSHTVSVVFVSILLISVLGVVMALS